MDPAGRRPDEDERIEIVRWPLAEPDRALAEVTDAKTPIGPLPLRQRLAAA